MHASSTSERGTYGSGNVTHQTLLAMLMHGMAARNFRYGIPHQELIVAGSKDSSRDVDQNGNPGVI